MYTKLSTILGGSLALASVAAAVPLENEKRGTISYGSRTDHMSMYSWEPVSSGSPGSSTGGNPGDPSALDLPLANGFPTIKNPSPELDAIEDQAHGTLPNAPPPPTAPAEDDLLTLRLIAFNEIWETAYFSDFLFNVTNNVTGYEFDDPAFRQTFIDSLTAIVAQEELHALNANGALAHFNAGPIQPCKYISAATDKVTATRIAATFTDMIMGTLVDCQLHFAQNGDLGLIRGVGGALGNEAEQEGYYRSLLGLNPSANAFLTQGTRELAFSGLVQNFIQPGSCPNIETINLPVFGTLNVDSENLEPKDQDLQFSYSIAGQYAQYANYQNLSLVYMNQQNVPVVEPITTAQVSGETVSFTANFPFSKNKMHGFTIAVVANGTGPFTDIAAVTKATVFGPGLIEVD